MELSAENLTQPSISTIDGAALHRDQWAVDPESRQVDEAHLVAAARCGDSTAFGELFNRYNHGIFCRALRFMRNHEDAEDVVQEAYQLAFIHLRSFKGGARFSTWLWRIAINVALMKLRKKSRKVEISLEPHPESDGKSFENTIPDLAPNPEQDCIREERSRVLQEALAELRPNARRVLELYEMEGCSIKEIAEDLGISVSAVKARLFHARPKIRRRLTRYFVRKEKRPNRLRFSASNTGVLAQARPNRVIAPAQCHSF